MASETDTFLAEMLPRQLVAERGITQGDAAARDDTWSQQDPVTLLGAWLPFRSGWSEVSEAFKRVASLFTELRTYDLEIVAAGASGDLAYIVAFEHAEAVLRGELTKFTLRSTHVFRRENGEWRVVHRHADYPPPEPV